MGYNSIVVVRNDGLTQIESDPLFGKNLADGIRTAFHRVNGTIEVPAGNHGNVAQVVECHHADTTVLVAVGGNIGEVKARTSGWRLNDPDLQHRLLLQWADRLGFTLVPKS